MNQSTLQSPGSAPTDTPLRMAAPLPAKAIPQARTVSWQDPLLGTISHALRTPLNSIIGFTGTLLMGLPGPLTGDQREQLEVVNTSARQQLALINDLLDLVRIETGTFRLTVEPIDVSEVIREVVASRQPLARSKGLNFTVHPLEEAAVVETDPRALRQILTKLVNNAIKFTSEGGVRIDLRRENGATAIAVSDTGIGINPTDQAELFAPFARIERGDVEREEGSGLGLHVSHKLAQLLNARITVESVPGRGSKFTLILAHQAHENS